MQDQIAHDSKSPAATVVGLDAHLATLERLNHLLGVEAYLLKKNDFAVLDDVVRAKSVLLQELVMLKYDFQYNVPPGKGTTQDMVTFREQLEKIQRLSQRVLGMQKENATSLKETGRNFELSKEMESWECTSIQAWSL